jgi:hypothetical protein
MYNLIGGMVLIAMALPYTIHLFQSQQNELAQIEELKLKSTEIVHQNPLSKTDSIQKNVSEIIVHGVELIETMTNKPNYPIYIDRHLQQATFEGVAHVEPQRRYKMSWRRNDEGEIVRVDYLTISEGQ